LGPTLPELKRVKSVPATERDPSTTDRQSALPLLMWSLLRSFIWLDKCLQANLEVQGWPAISRAESQVMLLASAGITRQIEISKALGLTRQAINQTMKLLKERRLIDILPDPEDRRCKVIAFAAEGAQMRADALKIIELMELELTDRIGRKTLQEMRDALDRNWGDIPIFDM
jgi:DNA-binding MarR family transcriptional regulator